MYGYIVPSLVHQGVIFTSAQGVTYALLNGQSISRAAYPGLSSVWPSGVYGGGDTSSPMHLPNLNNLYLRGNDFGRNADPNVTSRSALSGVAPSGAQIGSYQIGGTKSHSHASGTQNVTNPAFQKLGGGNERARNEEIGATTTEATIYFGPQSSGTGRPVELNTANIDFDVDHHKVYFYIAIN